MITIIKATDVPREDEVVWSFSETEIGYLLDNHDGETYLYYKGRLYETYD